MSSQRMVPFSIYSSSVTPFATNNAFILGIGTAVPNQALSQKELGLAISKDFSNDPEVIKKALKIFDQSQIETRHFCRNPLLSVNTLSLRAKETISDVNKQFVNCAPLLSKQACLRAIEDWGGSVSDITHIVSVSSTGLIFPDINFLMIQELDLNPDVNRISINFMGCLAGLSSLRTAVSVACHHPCNRILVVCTEICSIHSTIFGIKESMDQIVASSIFADGSAAYILGCNPSIYERPLYEVLGSMSRSVPNTIDAMTWNISTSGWHLRLDASIPDHIGSGIEAFVKELLDKVKKQTQSTSMKEYEFLIHTGGKAILKSIENSLGIDAAQNKHSWYIYKHYGNMSSPSVIFVMDHARRSKSLPEYSVALSFGPGLAFEGCVVRNLV